MSVKGRLHYNVAGLRFFLSTEYGLQCCIVQLKKSIKLFRRVSLSLSFSKLLQMDMDLVTVHDTPPPPPA